MSLRLPIAIALVLASSSRASAQHVLVVDPAGPYTQIQPAVDAAANGDTVLVHTGSYAGFTIGDKELSVVAAIAANVQVQGRVRVDGLTQPHCVLLAGIQIHPSGTQPAGAPAFGAQGDSGNIRIELCTITGADTFQPTAVGQVGAQLDNSGAVAFSGSTIRAGHGAPGSVQSWNGCAGGHAITARACSVALYDCILRGGAGGDGISATNSLGDPGGEGGRGGSGSRLDDGFLFVSGSQVYGGDGGRGGDSGCACALCGGPPGNGGPGGHGLFAVHAAPPHPNLVTLADMLVQGMGGAPGVNHQSYCWNDALPGADGAPVNAPAGTVDALPGPVRMLVAPRVVHETTSIPFAFHGVPGDVVRVYLARRPAFSYSLPFHGVILTQQPPNARLVSFGTIPASGTLNAHIALPDYGLDSKVFFLQSLFTSTTGENFLSSPDTLIELDSSF